MRAALPLLALLALIACVAGPTTTPERLAAAAAPQSDLKSRIVIGVRGEEQSQVFVIAETPEAADRSRSTLVRNYALQAGLHGMWGVRVAPTWREASLQDALAEIGVDASVEDIRAMYGDTQAFFLDATYLSEPVAGADENVYPALELPLPSGADGAGEEN